VSVVFATTNASNPEAPAQGICLADGLDSHEIGLDSEENKIGTFSAMSMQGTIMRRREWSRWGRGSCEGWSLEIGLAFRGSVVKSETPGLPTTWIASINTGALGEYLEREIAMRNVEAQIESNMNLVLHDWELYRSAKSTVRVIFAN
jgi:hypothetical protein